MFSSKFKGVPGTQSNSMLLQHFLGLPPHPPLCLCFIRNYKLLKMDQIHYLPLALLFSALGARESFVLSLVPRPSGCSVVSALVPALTRSLPFETKPLILWMSCGCCVCPTNRQKISFLSPEPECCWLAEVQLCPEPLTASVMAKPGGIP